MWIRLRTLPAQLLVLVILPLTVVLLVVAFGGAAIHTDAMRDMVAVRDEQTVRAASAALAIRLKEGETPAQLLEAASDWLSGSGSSSESYLLFLVDDQGQLVAHSDPALSTLDYQNHPGVVIAQRGDSGSTFQRHQETNQEVVIAYSPIGDSGWVLVLEEPWSAIANPLLRYSQIAPLALVPALMISAGALYFGLRQVVQPLQKLDSQAAHLGWGDFDALESPVGGIEEIQALHSTLVRMAHQLQADQAGMRSYAAALTQGQEEERARLARELHDETVQTLIALEHRAHLLRRAIALDPEAATQKVAQLAEMTGNAVQDLRRVIHALRPLYLDDLGWLPAVRALVDDLKHDSNMDVNLDILGIERRLEPATELALYRITQEALKNVARHSQAKTVRASIQSGHQELEIIIADDGQGFTPPTRVEELAKTGHFGLMGMNERAQRIGAQLRIESAPGQGTKIRISLQENRESHQKSSSWHAAS